MKAEKSFYEYTFRLVVNSWWVFSYLGLLLMTYLYQAVVFSRCGYLLLYTYIVLSSWRCLVPSGLCIAPLLDVHTSPAAVVVVSTLGMYVCGQPPHLLGRVLFAMIMHVCSVLSCTLVVFFSRSLLQQKKSFNFPLSSLFTHLYV